MNKQIPDYDNYYYQEAKIHQVFFQYHPDG